MKRNKFIDLDVSIQINMESKVLNPLEDDASSRLIKKKRLKSYTCDNPKLFRISKISYLDE